MRVKTKSFASRTGLMGATAPGQQVTKDNIEELPPGSVIRNGDDSKIIHLHDDVWYWVDEQAWLYDNVERMKKRLLHPAYLCHMP